MRPFAQTASRFQENKGIHPMGCQIDLTQRSLRRVKEPSIAKAK
jgi:hypothetical protein